PPLIFGRPRRRENCTKKVVHLLDAGGPTASHFFIKASCEKRSISASIRCSSCCITAACLARRWAGQKIILPQPGYIRFRCSLSLEPLHRPTRRRRSNR